MANGDLSTYMQSYFGGTDPSGNPKSSTEPVAKTIDPNQPSQGPTADLPSGPPTTKGTSQQPSFSYNDINGLYNKYLGPTRNASQDEYNNWVNGSYGATDLSGIENQIRNSGEARAWTASQGSGGNPGNPGGGDLMSRIQQALQGAHSTDDPNYWLQKISSDPNGAGSAWSYWLDRINRGDGSQTGLPKFNDGPSGGGNNNPGGPTTGFADPAYQQLLQLAQARTAALGKSQSFPQLDQYIKMLTDNQATAKQRAQTFADQLGTRVGQLQQPLLTNANVVQQRSLASNNLLAQRDATLKNQAERRYASGFEPTSGLLAGDQRSTNEAYTNAQAQIDAKLQAGNIAGDEARRNEATQLQGLMQQALAGGDVTALNSQATVADLENQKFNQDQQRQREQLSTAQLPVDLTNMGFANATNAANAGGNPLSALFSLISAAGNQQGVQQTGQNSNASMWGWLLQSLLTPPK